MERNWNCYANEFAALEPTGRGILDGKSFAVKDVFDIAGLTAGAGNPDWLRTHRPAVRNARAVDLLLRSGARLRGTTVTDELMYSINGENAHYGTPVNPREPGRIPGGSSSGSASAAAAGLADFAIGTDTGGSVRVPSSYCGLFGIRPTHGAVDTEGLIPLAPSFDTVGWMARDARTLREAGAVLLGRNGAGTPQAAAAREESAASAGAGRHGFTRLLIAEDMWELADEETQAALEACLPALADMAGTPVRIAAAEEGLDAWMSAFRHLQAIEIWQEHGEWIEEHRPAFGPGIQERFAWAATLKREEHADAFALRAKAAARLEELLDDDTLLIAPAVPSVAPLLNQSGREVERQRVRTLQLTCPAGLSGLPQATMPIRDGRGLPVGLSFIAGRQLDLRLLYWLEEAAERLAERLV